MRKLLWWSNYVIIVLTALAHLTLEGQLHYENILDREQQGDLTKSVKRTNNIQIASAITTFVIILGTLCVTYWDYKTHQEELDLLRSEQRQELSAKLIQERFVLYQTKIDSLYRVTDELKKQLLSKTNTTSNPQTKQTQGQTTKP